jgi:hypothetical protein
MLPTIILAIMLFALGLSLLPRGGEREPRPARRHRAF